MESKVTRGLSLPSTSDDSAVQLVTISVRLEAKEEDDGVYEAVLQLAKDQIEEIRLNDVMIKLPCNPYDCTGQAFTMSIEMIHEEVIYGWLHQTFIHYIGIDV